MLPGRCQLLSPRKIYHSSSARRRPFAVPISVGDTARLDGGLAHHENSEHVHQKYHRFIRKVMNEF